MIYDLRFAGRCGARRSILDGGLAAGGPWRSRGAVWLVLLAGVVPFSGCGQPRAQVPPPARQSAVKSGTDVQAAAPAVVDTFAPVRISILPLTEFSGVSEGGLNTTLTVYVALLDAFGSPLKTPGTLRFELYEYVPRSAAPKGQRTAIWPDVDLTGPVENNQRWRDFLRAYEFELDVRADRSKTYVLETTCLCPDGKRLTGEYRLRGPGGDKPPNGT